MSVFEQNHTRSRETCLGPARSDEHTREPGLGHCALVSATALITCGLVVGAIAVISFCSQINLALAWMSGAAMIVMLYHCARLALAVPGPRTPR